MQIRRATLADHDTLVRFNCAMALETEGKILDSQRIVPGVRRALEDPERGRYLLAEIEGRVVGQLMLTREWSDWRNGWIWWIQSVYVDPAFRRVGVFRALFRHVQQEARNDSDVVGLRLYVEGNNRIAQETYARLGLCLTSYQVMEQCPLDPGIQEP